MDDAHPSLKILIVGGGIGGLAAAIALRRQGHNVEIFEQSHLASEIGAAITIMPNADSVLKRLGVDVADCGGNLHEQTRYINSAGKILHVTDVMKGAHRWQASSRCVHRAHLHDHLKKIALSPDGDGPPALLHKAVRIQEVDPEHAKIVDSDGRTSQGDVLVGADGVHSVTRQTIEPSVHPYKTDRNAFRFLITRKAALEDPRTRELASTLGSMDMWYAEDRKIVMYPCDNNTLLNFVCVHPADLSDVKATAGYNTNASKEQLLKVYKHFDPVLKAFLEIADPETIKIWPLFDMEQLPTFVQGRMALIGDAAHPFLPHLGQGGAQAIEDGVALATMLTRGFQKSEVPLRLKLYNDARYEHGSKIQNFARLAGEDGAKDGENSVTNFVVLDFLEQAISHDEFHHSIQILRQHQWGRDAGLYWRHPVAFGPIPGSQQPHAAGLSRAPVPSQATCQTATISFQTSATFLRNLFPTESYMFKSRDTVAHASFRLQTFDNVPWLGGQGYHVLGLYIHNVIYKKRNGDTVEGTYIPVLFGDLMDTMLSDREELGMPQLYSDIEVNCKDDSISMNIGWRGVTWGRMEWNSLGDAKGDNAKEVENASFLTHKYIPATDSQDENGPDADYSVRLEDGSSRGAKSISRKRISLKSSCFQFEAHDWERLPTLHHIVSQLMEIPVFDVTEASVVDANGMKGFSKISKIE